MTTYIYGRVSTVDQNVDQQVGVLTGRYPHDKVICEHASGKTMDRPEFDQMAGQLQPGDTVVVLSVSRLGRNSQGVLAFVDKCRGDGIRVIVDDLGGLDVCSTTGQLVVTVLAAVAQMQREEMLDKQRIGIERAKSEGKYTGRRQSAATVAKLDAAVEYVGKGLTKDAAARAAGVGIATLYRHLKNLEGQV